MQEAQVYIVATPIGNKSDISMRAVDVLSSVDYIACEDCRTSAVLLNSYDISTKLISYHKFNEKQRTEEFVNLIKSGKKIALISDAGTPCISDPGRILVRELFEQGIKITAVPGASAITTFLSIIPRETEEFAFAGFLPRTKPAQEKLFEKYKQFDTVFYESANRLLDTLENIQVCLGTDVNVCVGRELTKKFEEIKYGTVGEIIEYFRNNTLKGEIVFVVYAKKNDGDIDLDVQIKKMKMLNYSDRDISQILSVLYGVNKNKIYKKLLEI